MDYLGVFDDVAKALEFDEQGIVKEDEVDYRWLSPVYQLVQVCRSRTTWSRYPPDFQAVPRD